MLQTNWKITIHERQQIIKIMYSSTRLSTLPSYLLAFDSLLDEMCLGEIFSIPLSLYREPKCEVLSRNELKLDL